MHISHPNAPCGKTQGKKPKRSLGGSQVSSFPYVMYQEQLLIR